MKIGIFYFSATGVTEIISNHISAVLEKEGNSVKLTNILLPEKRQIQHDFLKFDACMFGFPVFGGRPPIVVEEWISVLDGKNQKCSMFFTYGARDLEWAHQVTYYLLTHANFRVRLSAEFIGRHSFNVADGFSLAENRPNQSDLEVASRFAIESLTRFQKENEFYVDLSDFTYKQLEYKEWEGEWAKFYPSRIKKDCSMCFLCEKECPTKAFDAVSGKTNKIKCIVCMHCVTICPDEVIHTSEVSQIFQEFLKRFGLNKDIIKNKRSKIKF
jgi:flavodoxin/ferredoxin